MSDENALERIGGGALVAGTPNAYIKQATAMSKALADVINKQHLWVDIKGKKYVVVEGWTTLAAMMGVVAHEESNIQRPDGGYEAIVTLRRISDGTVITQASSECGTANDGPWMNRADFAKRSMAATRATSKACRLAFSWVMQLAGYSPTPAEEMVGQEWANPAATASSGGAPSQRGQGAPQGGGGRPSRPVCPKCGKDLFLSKFPDNDGDDYYYCWKKAKKNPGCGATYKKRDIDGSSADLTQVDDIIDAEVTVTETEPASLFEE